MRHQFPSLSIKQPWATLILSGTKKIELRRYSPKYNYRNYYGKVWLHTGLKPDKYGMNQYGSKGESFETGGYIGLIEIKSSILLDKERWNKWRKYHLDNGDFQSGFYAWILEPIGKFKKIVPSKGNLYIYDTETDFTRILNSQELVLISRAK